MQPLVREGSAGQVVRDLQALLNFVVPVSPVLATDGIFGPKTLNRVLDFQRQAALTADGIVGPRTGTALVNTTVSKLSPRL